MEEKKNPTGVIIAGYVFALLGGIIGIVLGIQLLIGHKRYVGSPVLHGALIVFIGLVAMVVWKGIALSQ